MAIDGAPLVCRRAELAEIFNVRWTLLRAGLERKTAEFPGDEEPTSRHYGAFLADRNVGCVSFMLSEWQGEPAYQMRGMATVDDLQSRGIGRALLVAALGDLQREGHIEQLWCNARVPAIGFYETMGWRRVGDEFDIPTAGPHCKMAYRLEGTKELRDGGKPNV